jgi:predicted RNase H-like HicB family nuclease
MENIREAIDLYLKNAEEYSMLDDINAAITSREKFTAVIEV